MSDAHWPLKTEILLQSLSEKAQTITYEALAKQADIPPPHRIHKLTKFLEELIAQDLKDNKPVRAALVISKVRTIPAPGFFDCLRAHGMIVPDDQHAHLHGQLLRALNPAF